MSEEEVKEPSRKDVLEATRVTLMQHHAQLGELTATYEANRAALCKTIEVLRAMLQSIEQFTP